MLCSTHRLNEAAEALITPHRIRSADQNDTETQEFAAFTNFFLIWRDSKVLRPPPEILIITKQKYYI